jgi:hypothetical protein
VRVDLGPDGHGDRWLLDRAEYSPGQRAGHYESFYCRANHPKRPLAFWIRYTLFSPAGRPADALGELWAVAFDGETGRHAVAKHDVPIADCRFDRDAFAVRVGDAELGPRRLTGSAGTLAWDLAYDGTEPPLLLLPRRLYATALPKAKSLVPLPLARYIGSYTVDGHRLDVDGWVGSQNHNWGREHTDRYAFGQVAGFDGEPDAFLEVATVRTTLAGSLSTPWLTTLVLRHRGVEHSLVSLRRAVTAKASYRYFSWDFASSDREVEITGRITAEPDAFVGLRYRNPPGGTKLCLNTKIGAAKVTVRDRRRGTERVLRAGNRALFEILTDDTAHGIAIRA